MSLAQNIYNSPSFFSAYATLPRSQHGLSAAPEWPTLCAMLGDLSTKTVLDLGCGYGWFCRYAVGAGAKVVRGLEISELMLEKARELDIRESRVSMDGVQIEYIQANLEEVELGGTWDVVYSSLTLHYLPTPAVERLLDQIYHVLVDGGVFVFSVEHPVAMAPVTPGPEWMSLESGEMSPRYAGDGGKDRNVRFWPLNSYAREGERVTDWLAKGVKKYHRRVETWIKMLLERGFVLEGFRESWDGMSENSGESERPYFMLIKVRKGRRTT